MAARTYRGQIDKAGRGGHISADSLLGIKPEFEYVTAYDARDVDPLVEAARNAVKELDYAPPGESERDASCRLKSKWMLEAALEAFDTKQEGDTDGD